MKWVRIAEQLEQLAKEIRKEIAVDNGTRIIANFNGLCHRCNGTIIAGSAMYRSSGKNYHEDCYGKLKAGS